jgi:hypothetical protein
MTVSELIKALSSLDGDLEVFADGHAISGAEAEQARDDAFAHEGYAFLVLDRPD